MQTPLHIYIAPVADFICLYALNLIFAEGK